MPTFGRTQGKSGVVDVRCGFGECKICQTARDAGLHVAQGFGVHTQLSKELLRLDAMQFNQAQHDQPKGRQRAFRFQHESSPFGSVELEMA